MDDLIPIEKEAFPQLLQEITDPPKSLYVRGNKDVLFENTKYLAVVGSRRFTSYGKQVCETLIRGLAGYPIVIVSGLALGIDAIAHKAALTAGLKTIAVPGSGLDWDVLYPQTHVPLARDIIAAGGALISEYEPNFKATPWSFPKRNRIMAGLSHATLVIEASKISGTLITARLALEYNREVLTVPGSIFNSASEGPHMLIRLGATPITSAHDILDALGIASRASDETMFEHATEKERMVLALLSEPTTKDELIRLLGMPTHEAQVLLSHMELAGYIVEAFGTIRKNS